MTKSVNKWVSESERTKLPLSLKAEMNVVVVVFWRKKKEKKKVVHK